MKLPNGAGETLRFTCNICGQPAELALSTFGRERGACPHCGSVARFRGVVAALGEHLGLGDRPLPDWPENRALRGLGMSDAPHYAVPLAGKFDYANSFFDREPRLDITAIPEDWRGRFDFVISSDVLEHVAAPLQRAFDNLLALLKPGGILILTVPYTRDARTLEHFPHLHRFEIAAFQGAPVLINRRPDGALELHEKLVFHGGDGSTLEMRIFCEAHVLAGLRQAGFAGVRVHDEARPAVGYCWEPFDDPGYRDLGYRIGPFHAYVITAVRPLEGGAVTAGRLARRLRSWWHACTN